MSAWTSIKNPSPWPLLPRTVQCVATGITTSRPTVILWRNHFAKVGIAGLEREPSRQPSSPRLKENKIKAIVEATLHTKPADATHWSSRTLRASRLSHEVMKAPSLNSVKVFPRLCQFAGQILSRGHLFSGFALRMATQNSPDGGNCRSIKMPRDVSASVKLVRNSSTVNVTGLVSVFRAHMMPINPFRCGSSITPTLVTSRAPSQKTPTMAAHQNAVVDRNVMMTILSFIIQHA